MRCAPLPLIAGIAAVLAAPLATAAPPPGTSFVEDAVSSSSRHAGRGQHAQRVGGSALGRNSTSSTRTAEEEQALLNSIAAEQDTLAASLTKASTALDGLLDRADRDLVIQKNMSASVEAQMNTADKLAANELANFHTGQAMKPALKAALGSVDANLKSAKELDAESTALKLRLEEADPKKNPIYLGAEDLSRVMWMAKPKLQRIERRVAKLERVLHHGSLPEVVDAAEQRAIKKIVDPEGDRVLGFSYAAGPSPGPAPGPAPGPSPVPGGLFPEPSFGLTEPLGLTAPGFLAPAPAVA